jgi:hypothetical protein
MTHDSLRDFGRERDLKRHLDHEKKAKRELVSEVGKRDGRKTKIRPGFPISRQHPVFLQTSVRVRLYEGCSWPVVVLRSTTTVLSCHFYIGFYEVCTSHSLCRVSEEFYVFLSTCIKSHHNRIPHPRWKSLESRGRQGSTVNLFGKEWKEFWPEIGTLSKWPSWHGGDILGNECRKLMACWYMLIYEQIEAFLLNQLEEDGGSERAKREVKKRCDIVAKALLLFDGFLSLLRTDHKDLTPQHITKARE